MITLYRTDGTKEDFPQEILTLEWMQEQVGGYVEKIHVTRDTSILCNEDGWPMKLPIAHPEVNELYHENLDTFTFLLGNCIVVSSPNKIP